jgi:hypothetical protein
MQLHVRLPMEQAMSSQNDDFDEETEAVALYRLIQDYVDEHDLSVEATSLMLLEISVRMHIVGYALETEKPSASGLKLGLDRFRREIDNLIRDAEKNADHFIATAKTLRAAAENEPEDPLDDERGLPS